MTASEKIYSIFHYEPSKPLKVFGESYLQNPEEHLSSSRQGFLGLPKYLTEQEHREELFNSLIINKNIVNSKGQVLIPNIFALATAKTDSMLLNKQRYTAIAHKFVNPGLQWWIIALIHEMECTQNFRCHLHNGDPLKYRTTHVPKGRPTTGAPPFSFEFSAIDALRYEKVDQIQDWSVGNVLYFLEGFNGYGYAKYRHINSPYLWSGSNQYSSGKYISDNVYSPSAVSQQVGIAVLMKVLSQKSDLTPTLKK